MISHISMPLHVLFPPPQTSLTYIIPDETPTHLSSSSLRCSLESLVGLDTPHLKA